jgi:tetratricopeptide (TPR) repeat protein
LIDTTTNRKAGSGGAATLAAVSRLVEAHTATLSQARSAKNVILGALLFFLLPGLLPAQDSDTKQAILSIQQAIQHGDLADASSAVNEALQRHPEDAGLLNLRGIVHAQRNEIPQARKDLSEAVRLKPDLTPAWQNLARVCQLEPESATCAIDSWQHVLRLLPGDQEAHGSLSLLYEKQHKYAPSLAESEKLSGDEAERTVTLAVRCADLCALGRTAEVRSIAAELASRSDFSGSDFDALSNAFSSPKSAAVIAVLVEGLDRRGTASRQSLGFLAVAYEQLQRPADARKTLERVAALDPKNPAHLIELARLADAAKDYEGALGYLAHARNLDPTNPRIHYLFAGVASDLELPLEARKSLEHAIELDPKNPDYDYSMGYVILSTRDAATAASYFAKFVQARPRDVRGHYALGIASFSSGDYATAKSELHIGQSDPRTAAGSDYFLGRIAVQENNLADAVPLLRKSIELMPDYSESHTEMARVCMLQKNLPEAKQELDRAIQLNADSFEANEQLLVLYKRMHDPRANQQGETVKKLDQAREKRADLMLRTIEFRP